MLAGREGERARNNPTAADVSGQVQATRSEACKQESRRLKGLRRTGQSCRSAIITTTPPTAFSHFTAEALGVLNRANSSLSDTKLLLLL